MVDTLDAPVSAPVIDCAAYCSGARVADLAIDQIRSALTRDDQFVWLGLYEPEQDVLRQVQQQFGLHDLAIEDAYNAHQRPKLELYEDAVFVVLRTAHLAAGPRHLEFGETHIFLGRNYVVTVRHGSLRSHSGVRQRCEATPHLLSKGPGYVLYALMDFVVDQYLPIVQHIEEEVEDLEDVIFGRTDTGDATARIYQLKRDLLALRRTVTPLVEVCNRLMRFDLPHIPEDTRVYFRDVYDHIVRLNETIDAQRELLTTALEAHLSLMSHAQNEHMKRITAWAAMIAVPTMIAGIYGMNFQNMPELTWAYGYHASLVIMVTACVGLYVGFKRSGWL
ncbi:MAG TPA: magnesium/cobalt transporter CorA [Vicinamibacterales bacterium]|nr:magnesium/cobalt transporter CorA [Vicinamibacterales bacterium]